jgi:plastocyanin
MRFGKYDIMETSLFGERPVIASKQFAGGEMGDRNESLRRTIIQFIIGAIAISLAALAQAQETGSLGPLNETKPAEVRIVSTEFRFSPTTVLIAAGRAVTLILDNSGAETEHGFFLPALGFRLEAKAGQIVRKRTVFVKPGEYKFICDLPGHHEAGMNGMLIVGPFRLADELPSISGGVQKYTGGTSPPALLQRE